MSIETLLSASRARLESPPLVRERPTRRSGGLFSIRITPARAGKTTALADVGTTFRDHPRSCGKDTEDTGLPAYFVGSPPLVRERPSTGYTAKPWAGITPARAGKTSCDTKQDCNNRDHPRSCGKDPEVTDKGQAVLGSPPLVRERQFLKVIDFLNVGITPARAGKTPVTASTSRLGGDHPRSCGKDVVSGNAKFFPSGSPPLVRERLRSTLQVNNLFGDHPRSCGKDQINNDLGPNPTGSPPLVRERLTLVLCQV